jgi:hypothetical protein
MTQPSNVRFVMEERFNDDLDNFKVEVNADMTNFEQDINNKIAPFWGQNYVMNGAFDIWQRGTSFGNSNQYVADRWRMSREVAVTTRTVTREPLNNAIAGLENVEYYLRSTLTTLGTGSGARVINYIEDVNKLAGKTVTLSWYGKHSSFKNLKVVVEQNFGDGGSASVFTERTISYTDYWIRHTAFFSMGNLDGKTVGPNSHVAIYFYHDNSDNSVLDITGVKLESFVSSPTDFSRQHPSIQSELAACQRYYYRAYCNANQRFGLGQVTTTTNATFFIQFPTEMRIAPTALEQTGTATNYRIINAAGTGIACSAVPVFANASRNAATITAASTYTAAGQATQLYANNTATYLGFNADVL